MNAQETQQALAIQANGHHRPPSSEATKVEQSRAIAQVQGALLVAMQNPRDELRAIERMRDACGQSRLADQAFFRYSRGGSQVTGPSIHLATELARCWGNIEYGVSELRRDEVLAVSEMSSYAWDQETNNRVTTTFIVPHKRDKRGGATALVDLRDIYENNANNAARRLRECILRVLPKAFVEEAKDLCMQTLQDGGGVPLNKRREKLIDAFAELHVTKAQIEHKVGRKADVLTALDISVLGVVYKSLKRGEASVEDEFQIDQTEDVAAKVEEQAKAKAPAKRTSKKARAEEPEGEAEPEQTDDPEPMTTEEFDEATKLFEAKVEAGGKTLDAYLQSDRYRKAGQNMTDQQRGAWSELVHELLPDQAAAP